MTKIQYVTPHQQREVECGKAEVWEHLGTLQQKMKDDQEASATIIITHDDGDVQVFNFNKLLPTNE